MKYYPAFLNMAGKRVLLVGGGKIAVQKAAALSRCGARVSVVAPKVDFSLRRLAERVAQRPFQATDLRGAFLVISATDDAAINARVCALCREKGIWVNVVDRPGLCDFIAPAVVRRGEITIAISSGGSSPGLVKHLRKRCEVFLRPEYARLARRLKKIRSRLLRMNLERRRAVLSDMISVCEKP